MRLSGRPLPTSTRKTHTPADALACRTPEDLEAHLRSFWVLGVSGRGHTRTKLPHPPGGVACRLPACEVMRCQLAPAPLRCRPSWPAPAWLGSRVQPAHAECLLPALLPPVLFPLRCSALQRSKNHKVFVLDEAGLSRQLFTWSHPKGRRSIRNARMTLLGCYRQLRMERQRHGLGAAPAAAGAAD